MNSLSEFESSAAALRLRLDLAVEPPALVRPLARGVMVLVRGVFGVETAVTLPADPDFASFFNLKMCSETARGVGLSSAFASLKRNHVSMQVKSMELHKILTPRLRYFFVIDGGI